MKIYQVGGSVRDKFLGVQSEDLDWVVVGARAEELISQGYLQVGADFPVFLHPKTGDEYALARTERKNGSGYLGFEVAVENVTLEEDLQRRDLTINAMALAEDGELIDPYDGMRDIHFNILRHVGPAFAEDPVRILRLLRFRARYGSEWTIAPETERLIHEMVRNGEASNLVPERIWKETSRAMMEPHPGLYFEGLQQFGLTALLCFQNYRSAVFGVPVLREATKRGLPLAVRVALVFGDSNAAECPVGVPAEVWKTTLAWSKFGSDLRLFEPAQHSEAVVAFLERVGAFKEAETLNSLYGCWESIGRDVSALRTAAKSACSVDTKAISSSMTPGPAVGRAISAARSEAIQRI